MAWLVLRSRAKFYQHGGYYVSKAEVGVAAMGLLNRSSSLENIQGKAEHLREQRDAEPDKARHLRK